MKFTLSVTIDRAAPDVFGYLADLENLPHWNYAIQRTRKITPGPVTVGTRYEQIRTVPSRQEESLEVVELEAGRRIAVRGTLNTLPARLDYDLVTDGGVTVLTNTVDLAMPGPQVLSMLAVRPIRSAVTRNLAVLKRILEDGNR
jgi:hypothetical protein